MKKVFLGLMLAGLATGSVFIWRRYQVHARMSAPPNDSDKSTTAVASDPLKDNLLVDRKEVQDWVIAVKCPRSQQ
ncbi:hypothetical protein [Lactiplantibacillus pingfangensis]|uniref:hypothetical protein n=1 Tax=Lactiplantibacillus pingfangensis TaxID=2559915 RepID=UPI0010F52B08|nr:hypothetical protein [Lactiplantibacillus pingfangensis]